MESKRIRKARPTAVAACVSLLVGLSACSNGSGDGPAPEPAQAQAQVDAEVKIGHEPTGEQIAAAKQMRHVATLGRLAGATVQVFNATDVSADPLFTTVTDANGEFTTEIPDYRQYGKYLIKVTGGVDVDFRDTGTRDASPMPFQGTLHALVDPVDLLIGPIRVSPLSDIAYRLLGGDLGRFTPQDLNDELNRIAGKLLKVGLADPSSAPASGDLNRFDPTNSTHRDALTFEFDALWNAATPNAQSVMQMMHSGSPELERELFVLLANLQAVPTLQEIANAPTVKFQAKVDSRFGQITSDVFNGVTVDSSTGNGDGFKAVLPRDDAEMTLTAANVDPQYHFDSWAGCDRVQDTTCFVKRDKDRTVLARFAGTPALVEGVTFAQVTPAPTVSAVSFSQPGVMQISSRDAALQTMLKNATAGQFISTGNRDHPMVLIQSIVSAPVSASSPVLGQPSTITSASFTYRDASPTEVFAQATAIAEYRSFTIDEVRSIEVGDGVRGGVATVIPPPDYTASVVAGTTEANAPGWFIVGDADTHACRGFSSDARVRQALLQAALAHTHPFDTGPAAQCLTAGMPGPGAGGVGSDDTPGPGGGQPGAGGSTGGGFSDGGDLQAYMVAKAAGGIDIASGRDDGAGQLLARGPAGVDVAAFTARNGEAQTVQRTGEKVWVAGVGPAVALGHNLFLANQEAPAAGLRIVALQDIAAISDADAYRRAGVDCAAHGVQSACDLVAADQQARSGLTKAGIPLLTSPLTLTLQKPGTNLSGSISLNLNIDLKPKASVDWSLWSWWIRASAGADYDIRPELGLSLQYGRSLDSFSMDPSESRRKFDREKNRRETQGNRIDLSKTLIKVNLGQLIPAVGTVLDVSLNLTVGLDVSGDISVAITPSLALGGDFGASVYYEYHCCRSNDREIRTWFNMPKKQPGISASLEGNMGVGPYAEVSLSGGFRGVAEDAVAVFARGGVMFAAKADTEYSYATRFRQDAVVWDGPLKRDSQWFRESCSTADRYYRPSSCQCDSSRSSGKCVQRGDVQSYLTGKEFPQVCVSAPKLSMGVSGNFSAGARTSAEHFVWPFSDWLGFMNKEFNFFELEIPIWSTEPAPDDADLTGCRDIR